jgi:cellobiose phosphorylase
LRLIRDHLYFPDGVRLMDTTCPYHGGVNVYFQRAETAANFGREIGLQYVHAHIRFVEAMAKIGESAETWNGLLKINPLIRGAFIKNARPCQANCYFSSSDACFDNRYDAMHDFYKLRTGDVAVKTGCRVYSSGPGIYLNQLISSVLGIRPRKNTLVIDPVLPKNLDGLQCDYAINGMAVSIVYHITSDAVGDTEGGVTRVSVNGKDIAFTRQTNPYRTGGAVIPAGELSEDALIEVFTRGEPSMEI